MKLWEKLGEEVPMKIKVRYSTICLFGIHSFAVYNRQIIFLSLAPFLYLFLGFYLNEMLVSGSGDEKSIRRNNYVLTMLIFFIMILFLRGR